MARNRRGARGKKSRNTNSWVEIPKESAKWESYYKAQDIIPDDEWDLFKKTCQSQLPLTFRITGSRSHANEIKKDFKEKHLKSLETLVAQSEIKDSLEAPSSISWYPDELAWQLNIPKSEMKKNALFKKTQKFLVLETEVGNISRQEAVSMIPPLLLDVKSHHYVLDMCAAPGSKTAQIVEALHDDGSLIPEGFVMANDSDYKRSHMLVHQLNRLNSANFVVVNHDAQMMPKFKTNGHWTQFDRVLCDVPCTGDGTMRKNVTVWKDWSIGNGLGLHQLQLNILNRGIQLLKNGGRLVYSTCSLNPVENEAVVAGALAKWGDKLKLVDCSNELPTLKRAPGMTNWKVFNKVGELINTKEELAAKQESNPNENKVPLTVFPPEKDNDFHLERCMRIYQHLQNTGGFFIAVFEKIDDVEDAEPVVKKQKVVPTRKERLPRDANEEPFVFLDKDHQTLKQCWDLYDIKDEFPRDSTLVRNATGEPIRSIYFVAPIIKDIITANEHKLKFVHSGIKLFVSQKGDRDTWRLQNVSIGILKPFVGKKRYIEIHELEILKILLSGAHRSLLSLKEVSESFYEQMEKVSEGSCFLSVVNGDNDILVPVWRGRTHVNLMVNKHDTFELLYRLFGIEEEKVVEKKDEEEKKEEENVEEKKEDSEEKREDLEEKKEEGKKEEEKNEKEKKEENVEEK